MPGRVDDLQFEISDIQALSLVYEPVWIGYLIYRNAPLGCRLYRSLDEQEIIAVYEEWRIELFFEPRGSSAVIEVTVRRDYVLYAKAQCFHSIQDRPGFVPRIDDCAILCFLITDYEAIRGDRPYDETLHYHVVSS